MNNLICNRCKESISNNTVCSCGRRWYINSNYISSFNPASPSGGYNNTPIEDYIKYCEDGIWRGMKNVKLPLEEYK